MLKRVLLFVILILFLAVMGFVLSGINKLDIKLSSDINKVFNDIDMLGRTFLNLLDAESGQRGFLLTEDRKFLEQYNRAVSNKDDLYRTMYHAFRNEPEQRKNLEVLKKLLDARFVELDQTIVLDKAGNSSAALNIVKSHEGLLLTNKFRLQLNKMVDQDRLDLDILHKQNLTTQKLAHSLLMLTFFGVSLTVVIFFLLMYRNWKKENQLRKKLETVNTLYQAILKTAQDGIIIINGNGIIETFNNSAETILGYRESEVVGQNVKILIPDPFHGMCDRLMEDSLSTGLHNKRINLDVITQHKDGTPVNLHLSTNKIILGTSVTFSCIIRDISAQKDYEQQLKIAADRLRIATSTAHMGVWDWNLEENTLIWDDTMYEIFGIYPATFDNPFEVWRRSFHPDDLAAAEKAMQTIISGLLQEYTGEFRIILPNNDIRVLRITVSVQFDKSEKPLHMTGIVWDITNIKQALEEQLKAKESAEEANRIKSSFLANMSHEIRTPITAVIGLNHLLQKTALNDQQKDYSFKIRMASGNLLNLINDILDVSKIESGELELESVEFTLNTIFKNLTTLTGEKALAKGLDIIYTLDPHIPGFLVGDSLRLGQILINLVNNAVNFTNQGWILVSSKVLEKEEDTIALFFSVSDSGIGISSQNTDSLFNAYTQADSSTTRQYGGTGLGLTISKKIIQKMGGKIWVESEEDKGSSFMFTINLGYLKDSDSEISRLPVDLQRLKIHLLDESKPIKKVLQKLLEAYDFAVSSSGSLSEAVTALHSASLNGERGYDLVIIDTRKDGLNGSEAVKRIRSDSDIQEQPKIILLDQDSIENTPEREAAEGYDAHLTKPLSSSVLFNTILQVFGKELPQEHQISTLGTRPPRLDNIRGSNILLVEDNEINRQIEREMLESEGMWVTEAVNGKDAVEKVLDSRSGISFDIVLMDLQMPLMDGFHATQEIRKETYFSELPIIAMTADVMGTVKQKCMDAGMNDYVSKPIDLFQLYAKLVEYVKPGKREQFLQEIKQDQGIAGTLLEDSSMHKVIDIKTGLQRVQQNWQLYLKLLRHFKDTYSSFKKDMTAALEGRDVEVSLRLAHTLKGVAGNLGAHALSDAAEELEKNIRENRGEISSSSMITIDKELQQVVNFIDSFGERRRNTSTGYSTTRVQSKELPDLLREAEKMLVNYDVSVLGVVEKIRLPLVSEGYHEETDSLFTCIEKYDFEEALLMIRTIIHKMEEQNEQ